MKISKRTKSNLILFLTAFIWGSAFVAQKVGGALGPFTYNGVRTLLGGLVLIPAVILSDRADSGWQNASKEERKLQWKVVLTGGILCGLMHFIASTLQQIGIEYTTASKAGFITSLYAILVPLISVFIGKHIRPLVWVSCAVSVTGLYLISMKGGHFTLQFGDLLVLLCALFFAFQIMVIDHYSPKCNGVKMSCIQFLLSGTLGVICMFIFETPHIAAILHYWFPIVYGGVLSTGLAYTLQIIGQKNTPATEASLILCLEAVFSALTSTLLLHELLSPREYLGCALIFGAVILSQLPEGIVKLPPGAKAGRK
ncbi:MAG: DMT family transporter [Eubacterium sp.]|jgi:drug/metabolite transporter (DMT)-like permease|nr:DMT family transporter [Eubacterium sp.]MCH4046846.1 DMT family transporter [Eubacterium sp.]MCH4079943.1 DMT family transporter [Eubacterium sp.]MCH4110015.1 DMT family transporter [Eubacterium sp.]MCI1306562.1 DMT family transporter [Eubacterium sp.]